MNLRFLLDTSVVSSALWQTPDPTVVRMLDRHSGECAVAAPGWNELVYGMERLPQGKRRKELEDYLIDVVQAEFPILPYDEAAATWHAAERVRLESAGKTPPFIDGQIAAIAHVNSLVLVTRNTKDFASFTDLPIDDWRN